MIKYYLKNLAKHNKINFNPLCISIIIMILSAISLMSVCTACDNGNLFYGRDRPGCQYYMGPIFWIPYLLACLYDYIFYKTANIQPLEHHNPQLAVRRFMPPNPRPNQQIPLEPELGYLNFPLDPRPSNPQIIPSAPTPEYIKICQEIERLKINDFPHAFTCPITHQIMADPVICDDGYTYERVAITEYLKTHNTSPITRLPVKIISENRAIKDVIYEYLKSKGCEI